MDAHGMGNIIIWDHHHHTATWHKNRSVGQQNIAIFALDPDILDQRL